MKSLLVFTVLLLVCSLCDPTRSSPSGRVRRQGWAWGADNDRRPTRPTRQTNAPTAATTPSTTAADNNGDVTTTTASPQFTACFNSCRSTLQYNPVCGTNRVTYDNEGRLNCARRCGADVTMLFMGNCSPASK